MIKINDQSNHLQKSALLNECKGNIFEFIVAQNLASFSNLEAQFLYSIPAEFKFRLLEYEEIVREFEPMLLTKLPEMAKMVAHKIWIDCQLNGLSFIKWNVIGKMVATNDQETWNETDIVGSYVLDGQIQHKTFSLKLTKDNSFTNTKSAGVKSFIEKYFSTFAESTNFQSELNEEVEKSFFKMGHRLYELQGLDFNGHFDEKWKRKFSELPGDLPEDMKPILYENYNNVAKKIYYILTSLKKIDEKKFKKSLFSLCGFGQSDIIQINCFHTQNSLKNIEINSFDYFFSNSNASILPIKELSSSVEIDFGNLILQIRVKPMNKFTQPAYKINCSVKAYR